MGFSTLAVKGLVFRASMEFEARIWECHRHVRCFFSGDRGLGVRVMECSGFASGFTWVLFLRLWGLAFMV